MAKPWVKAKKKIKDRRIFTHLSGIRLCADGDDSYTTNRKDEEIKERKRGFK